MSNVVTNYYLENVRVLRIQCRHDGCGAVLDLFPRRPAWYPLRMTPPPDFLRSIAAHMDTQPGTSDVTAGRPPDSPREVEHRVRNWMQLRTRRLTYPSCPICENGAWKVGPVLPGPVPLVPLVCGACANVQFLAADLVGVSPCRAAPAPPA